MSHYSPVVILTAVLMLIGPASARGDGVKASLDAAKSQYQADMEKFRGAVEEWFDKREGDARRAGNKKVVDQVKVERDAFRRKGELTEPVPGSLKLQPRTARAKVEDAYEDAIKSYTTSGNDEQATAVEEELRRFRATGELSKRRPDADDGTRRLWKQSNGYFMKGLDKDWFEKWEPGKPPNLFYEVQRTDEYVELRHSLAPTVVRLYKNRAEVMDPGATEFRPLFAGQWESLGD